MDLHQLRTFAAIVDAGGVARAAARLNLSQPAASRQIKILEAELGVPLFDRVGRRVRLTSEGEDLLRFGRRLVAAADALRERAHALKGGHTGRIKVGATPPMIEALLAPFLAGHRRRHPGVEINIVEDGGAGLAHRLESGELHVAYVPVGDERLRGRLLFPIHVIAVVPDGHPWHRRKLLVVAQLASERLLLLRRGFASREWFDAACQRANIQSNVLFESNAHNAIVGLTAAGHGVGILPSTVRLPDEGVWPIPLVHRQVSIGRWGMLAWNPLRLLAPYLKVFIEEFAKHAQRGYPGRDLVRRAPPLRRPTEPPAA
jgi:LysR family cyn operon transcriptional activator